MAQTANVVQLKPRTLQAFEDYIRDAEAAMQPSLKGASAFLWSVAIWNHFDASASSFGTP